jgi:hypothetical protein
MSIQLKEDKISISWNAYRRKRSAEIPYGDIASIQIKKLPLSIVLHLENKEPFKIPGQLSRKTLHGLNRDQTEQLSKVRASIRNLYLFRYDLEKMMGKEPQKIP